MSEEDESMAEQSDNESGLDFILSLEDVPSKMPPHLELFKTRVICNSDAPIHVNSHMLLTSFKFLILHFLCYIFLKKFSTH